LQLPVFALQKDHPHPVHIFDLIKIVAVFQWGESSLSHPRMTIPKWLQVVLSFQSYQKLRYYFHKLSSGAPGHGAGPSRRVNCVIVTSPTPIVVIIIIIIITPIIIIIIIIIIVNVQPRH
jgi:hypothetical protein